MLNITKRTYPIHAFVGKRGCETKLIAEIAQAKTNRLGALIESLPAVGYIHYKFWDAVDEATTLRTLKINIGVSLCSPDDYKHFSSVIGKEMACDLASGTMLSNFSYHNWEREPGETSLHYVGYDALPSNKAVLSPKEDCDDILDHCHDCLPSFMMKTELSRIFDRVELTIYSNLQSHRFTDTYIRGSEILYIFNEILERQIRSNLYWCIYNYMHKRFPKYYVPLKQNKMLPIKNFTKIIPVKTDVTYTDLKAFGKKHKEIFGREKQMSKGVRYYWDSIVGYIAIRVESGKVYTGMSYVHPSDFFNKKNKYGKRLAYSRLMKRRELNQDGVDILTKKLCRRDDMDIQYIAPSEVIYYNYGFNDLGGSIREQLNDVLFLHGVQENQIESFVKQVMDDLFGESDMDKKSEEVLVEE